MLGQKTKWPTLVLSGPEDQNDFNNQTETDEPDESISTCRLDINSKLEILTNRWKGTIFQQVGERCGLISKWSSNEKEIGNTMLDWFIENNEEQLTDKAWDIVEGLEGKWKADGMEVRE